MSDYFLGEIRAFGFDWAPQNWALANGAVMQLNQAMALYSLLGISYGGDGKTTFKLPDLRGRTPVSWGSQQAKISAYIVGNVAGAETVGLTADMMPVHNHTVLISTQVGTTVLPSGDDMAAIAADNSNPPLQPNAYGAANNLVALNASTIANNGGGAAHDNMQPFTVVNYCIALQGLYPSRQ